MQKLQIIAKVANVSKSLKKLQKYPKIKFYQETNNTKILNSVKKFKQFQNHGK